MRWGWMYPAVIRLEGFGSVSGGWSCWRGGGHPGVRRFRLPSAIATTLDGLRASAGDARIVVAMEPPTIPCAWARIPCAGAGVRQADAVVFLHRPELEWDSGRVVAAVRGDAVAVPDADALVAAMLERVGPGDRVVFMSNGGFDDAPRRFLAALQARAAS